MISSPKNDVKLTNRSIARSVPLWKKPLFPVFLQLGLKGEQSQRKDWSFGNQVVELSGRLLAIVIALAVLASFDDYSPP